MPLQDMRSGILSSASVGAASVASLKGTLQVESGALTMAATPVGHGEGDEEATLPRARPVEGEGVELTMAKLRRVLSYWCTVFGRAARETFSLLGLTRTEVALRGLKTVGLVVVLVLVYGFAPAQDALGKAIAAAVVAMVLVALVFLWKLITVPAALAKEAAKESASLGERLARYENAQAASEPVKELYRAGLALVDQIPSLEVRRDIGAFNRKVIEWDDLVNETLRQRVPGSAFIFESAASYPLLQEFLGFGPQWEEACKQAMEVKLVNLRSIIMQIEGATE